MFAAVVQISISRGDVRVFFLSADKKVFKSDMTFSPQLLNAIIRLLFIRGRSQHKMAGLTGSSISQVLTHAPGNFDPNSPTDLCSLQLKS